MPKGPNGEKRPADAVGLAVTIGKIATGENEDMSDDASSAAAQMGKLGLLNPLQWMRPKNDIRLFDGAGCDTDRL